MAWTAFSASSSEENVTNPNPRERLGSSRSLTGAICECVVVMRGKGETGLMTIASVTLPCWRKAFLSVSVVVRLGRDAD